MTVVFTDVLKSDNHSYIGDDLAAITTKTALDELATDKINTASNVADNQIIIANLVTGKLLQGAPGAFIDDSGNLTVTGNLISPTLTGAPTAPTPPDNSTPTAIATTQYVADNAGGGESLGEFEGGDSATVYSSADIDLESGASA